MIGVRRQNEFGFPENSFSLARPTFPAILSAVCGRAPESTMSSSITSALAPKSSAPRRRSRRLRYVVLAGLLYTVVSFFVVPPIVKWQLREQLPVYTHRQATVQQVRVNPFTLSLTVRGLALTETNGTPFVGCDERTLISSCRPCCGGRGRLATSRSPGRR